MGTFRFAFRQLSRSPGFAAVALITLALGIGACTAIFSIVRGVLFRPLPFAEPDRLLVVRETFPPRFPEFAVSPGHYTDWREQATSFQSLSLIQLADGIPGRPGAYALTSGNGEPVRVSAARVTANLFATLGVQPVLGRSFLQEEDAPGKSNVVILTHGFWQRKFGGRPEVLFTTVQLDGQPFTVVGVMPPGFELHRPFDIITPVALSPAERQDRGGMHVFDVVGRLASGITIEQARNEMSLVTQRIAKSSPESSEGWGAKLIPMLEARVGDLRPLMYTLFGAVAFLLLIACANVANLILARGTSRSKELAIRAALGAGRWRIVGQLLIENTVLSVLGGVLGLLVASWTRSLLVAIAPEQLPRVGETGLDAWALVFSFLLALVAGVAVGLVPALEASRVNLVETLAEGGRGNSGGARRKRLRRALVTAQIAIALVLLVGAGLLVRSFALLQRADLGFRPDNAMTVSLSLPEKRYGTPAQQVAFADQVVERIAAIPGVQSIAVAAALPFSGDIINIVPFKIFGRQATADLPTTNVFQVTPRYFEAMGIPLLRGRSLAASDTANTPRVIVINATMARKFFAGEDPIGRRVAAVAGGPDVWHEIIGVVGDVKADRPDGEVPMQVYAPFAQEPWSSLTIVARGGQATTTGLGAAIVSAIRAVDQNQVVKTQRSLSELVAQSVARQRFAMLLLALFSGAALLLAAIGIYGIMAYSISQRTSEIAIRKAIGAQTTDVVVMVLGEGARLVAVGLVVGYGCAVLLTRLLSSLLFGVSAHDPLTLAAVGVLFAVVAAAACLFPALRAAKIEPMAALRAA